MNPFEGLSDDVLMKYYQKGENQAFEILYLRHKDRVYSYLSRRVKDENDRAEIFQNIFLKFHKSRSVYDPKYSAIQWIYTISRSELLDFVKKKRIKTVPIFEEIVSEEETTVSPDIDLDELNGLTDREREVTRLRYYQDLDYDEISKVLGTSQGNVRKILSRGIGKLRKIMRGGSYESK